MKTPLQIATGYANTFGWSVIPIDPKSKKPAIAWEKYQTEAAELDVINQWFKDKTWADIGVGVVCGKVSGITVLDDDHKGDIERRFDSTMVSKTGGGGRHYFYKYEPGLKNGVRVMEGFDIRNDGGQVVAPYSIHPVSKLQYGWIKIPELEPGQLLSDVLPPLPREVIDAMKSTKDKTLISISDLDFSKGHRNDSMFRLAGMLWRVIKTESDISVAYEVFSLKNKLLNPPLDKAELDSTWNSASGYIKPGSVHHFSTLEEQMKELELEEELRAKAPSTGYQTLDKKIGGWVPGHLIILTADTNMGKTTVAANFAYNLIEQGRSVLYLALETGTIFWKYVSAIAYEMPIKEVTMEDMKGFMQHSKDHFRLMDGKDCFDYDTLEQAISEHGRVDLVVIDHIGYFTLTTMDNMNALQSNLIKRLCLLAKKNQTTIMAVAHLRKRKDSNSIISKEDISGAAAYFQDAQEVIAINRKIDHETNTKNSEATIDILKKKAEDSPPERVFIKFLPGLAKVVEVTEATPGSEEDFEKATS